ncbi:HTTM domain-containing protein [Microbacterium testaceum]|uniref:HTTM domain-containing protein n=1 Tax=Microbacterium testaceum TaxID=2033 RepID=UPI00177DF5C5|nr:HTTM domain-containing protein [Microbacterium testaceum]
MTAPAARRAGWPARVSPTRSWISFQQWLTSAEHATIGFSMLRIIFAVAMLLILLPSYADRHYLWGAGSWWVEPEARRAGWWEPFRLIFSKTDPVLFDVAYFTLIALVVLFLVGYRTRLVTPVLLLFWVGLSTNSTLLTNGGDTLMRIILVFALFADLSRHFSVDAWRRRRRGDRVGRLDGIRRRMPSWLSPLLHNTALILCCYQILLVYLVASLLKLQGEEWLSGTALYYALSLREFQVLPALSEAAWQFAPFIMAGTWFAVVVQLTFPLALLWKPSRYVAVAGLALTHVGIGLLLGLWPFSLAMIALDLLLVRDASWARVEAFARSAVARARARASVVRARFAKPAVKTPERRAA